MYTIEVQKKITPAAHGFSDGDSEEIYGTPARRSNCAPASLGEDKEIPLK